MKTVFFSAVWQIIRKDIRIELRSRELVSTMALFSLLSVLIFSFSLELNRNARQEAISGVLWVTIVFAGILGLNRIMAAEREQGGIDSMLIAPIDRAAIFVGKLAGTFMFSLVIGLALIPLMTVLYNVSLIRGWLFVVIPLGTLGYSTIGTLLSAMTAQTRARESLLPIVLLPIVLPVLLASVRASTNILNDVAIADWIDWVKILAVLDVIYLIACFLLFPYIIEE